MPIELITTHKEDAKARLLSQYIGKPNIEGLLDALVDEIQELEQAYVGLKDRLDIDVSSGNQLDRIGVLVGQDRLGQSDIRYRILLKARIGANVSQGEPESVITVFKLVTEATFIHYMNLLNGEIALGTDGTIDRNEVNFILKNLSLPIPGGVRLDYIQEFSPDEAFAFAGVNTSAPALGFGTVADVNVGGKFSEAFVELPPFGFDGSSSASEGFGTIQDPLVGGAFDSL